MEILMDGRTLSIEAGGILRVKPGESVTLLPNHYHTFWAESDKVLFGEVTMTNNVHFFHEILPGSMTIEEDVPPVYLLSNEYPNT